MHFDKTYFLKSNNDLFTETLKEFSTYSYDLASLNSIIKNSHFNKGSFYYRFKDKLDLYIALFYDVIVKQYDAVSNLRAITLNDNSLHDYINILFESQYELYMENPLYISFIRNFSKESPSFKKEVISQSETPIIDLFFKNLNAYFNNHSLTDHSQFDFLVFQIYMNYYNFDQYITTKSSNSSFLDLSKYLLSGMQNIVPGINKNQTSRAFSRNLLGNLFTTDDQQYEFIEGEILAIVGPKSSGKTTIASFIESNISNNHNFKCLRMNMNKSLIWNIKHNLDIKILDSDFKSFLSNLSLTFDYKIKLNKLDKTYNKLIELYMKYLVNKSFIIIDDLFDYANSAQIEVLSSYLSKWKNNGSAIVLTSRNLHNIVSFSDRIGFLIDGHLTNIKSVYELLEKYGKITHIVKYFDNNIVKVAAFSNENLNKEFLKRIIDQYQVLSFETKTVLPDEVYKLETGVKLS